jgi:hypothetical protein
VDYRLLSAFKSIFEGKKYRHRSSGQGDRVSLELYEDLYGLGKSKAFVDGVKAQDKVLNIANKRRGIKARRGDGTFGEHVPGKPAALVPGFSVARGTIANVEIGIEAKFVSKAMIKQVDRVMSDLEKQLKHFHRGAANPICVAVVGINFADYTIGYEGEKVWRTDGKKHKHPIQEAAEVENRLRQEIAPKFYEFVILKYRATNDDPYPFEWLSYADTFQDYGAALIRISREYDTRFGT